MSQSIQYKSLFEVKIRHHFFLNKGDQEWDSMTEEERDQQEEKFDVRDILDIVPTADCKKMLSAHNCIFRKTSSGILVGIKAIPDESNAGKFKPYVSLNDDETFRFTVQIKDYNFLNYTALPLQSTRDKLYVLTNSIITESNIFPSLSTVPSVFEGGETYMPGDMLSDDATNQTTLYTALVKTTADPAGSSDWLTENQGGNTQLSYLNNNDSYPLANGFFIYTMKEKDSLPVAQIKDAEGYTIHPKMEILQGDFFQLQIDMSPFKEGLYTVQISSESTAYQDSVTFYLLQSSATPFAVMEIKVKSRQTSYDLLDQEDLRSPVFEMRLRNRRTFWRYLSKKFSAPFISANPLPLTRYGNIQISKPPELGETEPQVLPNPSFGMIKAEALNNTSETKYYSEIHIN